jgi:hypothetical protein
MYGHCQLQGEPARVPAVPRKRSLLRARRAPAASHFGGAVREQQAYATKILYGSEPCISS